MQAILLALLAATQEPPSPSVDLARIQAVLTAEIERTLATGVPSISIALVRGEDLVWSAAFGHSNVWARTPATTETVYCTGSTFKAVTASAVLQLVEAGRIRLDDPVNLHLGEHPVRDLADRPVTLRHILSHASGLTAGANTVPLWQRRLPQSLEALVDGLEAKRPPEEEYEYNNFAYGLAGYLVERVSGEDFEDYVVEHVLRPLGVRTRHPIHPDGAMVERMALPYAVADGEARPLAQVRFDVFPAGDVWLTAEDMARFLAAHLSGGALRGARILSPESVAEAHRPQAFDYGLGWAVAKQDPRRIAHSGAVPGFLSFMVADLEAGVGAYVVSNGGDVTAIGEAAVELLAGREWVSPADRTSIEVGAEQLEELVGTYALREGFALQVTHEGGRLHVQATGQPRLELFADAPDHFFLRVVDARLVFLRDAEGRVDRAELHQGGMVLVAARAKE